MVISPNQAPDPKDVEDALRSLNVSRIREGRGHVATDETDGNGPLDFGRDFAPSIVPRGENAQIGTEERASNKASLGKRVAGATIGSIVIAIVVTFAWQGSSIYSKKSKPSSDLAVSVSPQSSDQTTPVPQQAPTPVVAEVPPELLQQVQTIVSDLAALQHTVEEIASKQEQTSRDIASIQVAEQNLSKQISSLPRANVVRAARGNGPRPPALSNSQASARCCDRFRRQTVPRCRSRPRARRPQTNGIRRKASGLSRMRCRGPTAFRRRQKIHLTPQSKLKRSRPRSATAAIRRCVSADVNFSG